MHQLTQRSAVVLLTGVLAACGSTGNPQASEPAQIQGVKNSRSAASSAQFSQQALNWQDCQLPSAPGAQCTTVQAPIDWYDAGRGLLDVAVLKVSASEPARRRGILLVNPGGPGGPGTELAAYLALAAPELAKVYDIIGFDPRGVGGSTNLNCVLDLDFFKNYDNQELARIVAKGCQGQSLSSFVNTEQTARDMDLIRAVLGEEKTSYLGYSYGTWLGAWYAARFPERVDRFVLDSNVDTSAPSLQNTFELQPMARERAVSEGFFPWLARSVEARSLPYRSDMPRAALELRVRYEQFPPELRYELRNIIVMALYNPQYFPFAAFVFDWLNAVPQSNLTAGQLHQQLGEAVRTANLTDELRAGMLDALQASSPVQQRAMTPFALDASTSTFFAVTCNDGKYTPSGSYWNQFGRRAAAAWPFVGDFYGMQPCAYWPAQFSFPKIDRQSFPPVLMVQSEMDSATAYEGARRTRQQLPGARMISVDNEFAHGIYPYSDTCVDRTVEAYLLQGQLPATDVACAGLPLPLESQVYEVGGQLAANGKMQQLQQHAESVRVARRVVKNLIRTSNP